MGSGFAAEPVKLPLELGTLVTAGRTYEGAKITGYDAVGVKLLHEAGTARVPYDRLPPDLSSRFEQDRQAAREQLLAERVMQAENDQRAAAVETRVQQEEARYTAANGLKPKMTKFDAVLAGQRVVELQNYIGYLKLGIVKARGEYREREMRADQAEARSYYRNSYYYSNYRYSRRGDSIRRSALKYQTQIEQAMVLIDLAQDEITRLEGGR